MEYAGADVSSDGSSDGDAPVVTVALRNTGERPSREVVQVYFSPADGTQPIRLVGWAATDVDPGATAEVAVRCDSRPPPAGGTPRPPSFMSGSAAGELLVARGLGDVRLRLPLS